MHKLHIWICVGFLVLLGIYFVYQVNSTESESPDRETAQTVESETDGETPEMFSEQKDETGAVTVSARPIALPEDGTWDFEFTLQTHSVELDMDIIQSVVLINAAGKEISPEAWEGDVPGGHHRTGTLRFAPLTPKPDSLVLLAKNIADVPVRELTWNLQN